MQSIITYIKAICSILAVTLLAGCASEDVIPKGTLSEIISEMYLADQYIENVPHLNAESDTMYVYPAILASYGYTVEEYSNSVRYYIQEQDSYKEILLSAKKILEKRHDELDRLVAGNRKKKMKTWWAIDLLATSTPDDLVHDRLLRSVRWLVMGNAGESKWRMGDDAIADIPQNPVWWSNTANPPQREYATFIVREEKEKETKNKNEKNSSKLSVSDNRGPRPQRLP